MATELRIKKFFGAILAFEVFFMSNIKTPVTDFYCLTSLNNPTLITQ